LDAAISIYAEGAMYEMLNKLGDELRFVFITSDVALHRAAEKPADAVADDSGKIFISVRAIEYQKCARCWHKRADVGSHAEHPELCGRCVTNISGAGEERRYV